MKRNIRIGLFETNSSATHSMTICSSREYKEWADGERVYDRDERQLIALDETNDEYPYAADVKWYEKRYLTEREFWQDKSQYYEIFSENYTSESGDDIVIFGWYSRN